ncbi:MAG: carbohydrate kinase family protein [Candidatus Bathyarchaeales archaeon]
MFDLVSVGHFTIDSIFLPDRRMPFVVLGGSVAYVSFAARHLNATVSVVSKVGDDFPKAYLWWLGQEGVDLSGVVKVESACTTRFELEYTNDLSNRNLQLKNKAPPITVEDLPKSLKAKAIHIAPIAGEITCEVAKKLKNCADLLSIDPQGLVRKFDERGNVTHGSLTDRRILELVDIYKSSLNEIKAVTGISRLDSAVKAVHDYGVKTVIVTLGMKGAVLSVEETIYNIPAYKSEKFVDPTGAGDVFIGGFLAEYIRGENSLWCACVGSAAASFVVEAAGPTFFGDKAEVYRRARVLYEKEIKQ